MPVNGLLWVSPREPHRVARSWRSCNNRLCAQQFQKDSTESKGASIPACHERNLPIVLARPIKTKLEIVCCPASFGREFPGGRAAFSHLGDAGRDPGHFDNTAARVSSHRGDCFAIRFGLLLG